MSGGSFHEWPIQHDINFSSTGFAAITPFGGRDGEAHVSIVAARNRPPSTGNQNSRIARRGNQREEEHPRKQHLQQHAAAGEAQGPDELGSTGERRRQINEC